MRRYAHGLNLIAGEVCQARRALERAGCTGPMPVSMTICAYSQLGKMVNAYFLHRYA